MYFRLVQQFQKLQKLPNLRYRANVNFFVKRSYATLQANNFKCLPASLASLRESFYVSAKCNMSQVAATETSKSNISNHITLEQCLGKLEAFHQLNGFVSNEHLLPLIESLNGTTNSNLTAEQFSSLLNVCGCETPALKPEERMDNFQQIWKSIEKDNLFTKEHYKIKLQALKYNRMPITNHQELLEEFKKVGGVFKEVLPDLLAVAGNSGNIKQATELLNEMRTSDLALTESDFNSLMLAYGRSGDLQGCKTVLDSMQAAGVFQSSETQSTSIVINMENNMEEAARALLKQFHGQFKSLEVLKMLRSLVWSSRISEEFVKQLVKQFDDDYLRGIEVPLGLRYICIELLHHSKLEFVSAIINSLPQPNFPENHDIDTFGSFLFHAMFRQKCSVTEIIDIATQLEDSMKNTRALFIAAELALRRNPPMALSIFDALIRRDQTLRPHYFWPLMMYNFRRSNEAGIMRTLSIMKNYGVECDQLTLKQYILPRLSLTLENPELALKQFENVGLKTSLILTPIVSHLLMHHKWIDVAPLVEKYTTKVNMSELIGPLCSVAVHVRATKKFHQYAKLLAVLIAKSGENKQDFIGQLLTELLYSQARFGSDLYSCHKLLHEIQKVGLYISPAAADTVKALLTESLTEDSKTERFPLITQKLREMTRKTLSLTVDGSQISSFVKHPRNMTLDELECHLVELEAKGMNTRGILRRMLQLSVRDNRLKRALELKQKCDHLKVHTSPGMLASITEMYVKLKDLNNAQQCLSKLQEDYPGFLVDEHKFIDYAALLVQNNQLTAAKTLLEDRAKNNRITGGDYLLKNVWNLLTSVAHQAALSQDLPPELNLTQEFRIFLQKLGYCRIHNTILGPEVRERLLRDDLPAAIKEFKHLAQQYKYTPLQFELLSLLVRLGNADSALQTQYKCSNELAQQFLSEVSEIITQVHGIVNMNSGLLLAFAESGTDNQLRRLLINPEFRINEELLIRNCEHLGEEGAVQTLTRLARGTRGLNRVIDEQNIYKMILNNFVKSNDHAAALKLYERLESDDELKISQDFVRTLVNLLRLNNVKIPSNLALKAQIT
uniref:Pentatricopeptide repeat-containing protein-mitochondrial domain-containing protein n=1 Tax=Glossina brevipalpis TaxID=37001 RepID=A0A1A9WFX4_9MUSC